MDKITLSEEQQLQILSKLNESNERPPSIKELIELIRKNNYSSNEMDNLVSDYSIIDYIEFLCGNIYYETFVFELNKIDKQFKIINFNLLTNLLSEPSFLKNCI